MAWDDGEREDEEMDRKRSRRGSGRGQMLLAAECSNARVLLQVKMEAMLTGRALRSPLSSKSFGNS